MIFINHCLIFVLVIKIIDSAECPFNHNYSSSDGVYYEMMKVPFPENNNNAIQFHVQLSIGKKVSEQGLILSFLGTADDIKQQQPLNFKLLWPAHLNNVARKITQITVNNHKFCSSDRLDTKNFNTVSEINLSVNLRISTNSDSKKPSTTSPPVADPPNQQPNFYYDITSSTTTQPIKQNYKSNHCYKPPSSNNLIFGGDSAEIGDYPFLGALAEMKDTRTVTVLCGVTLITEKLVLTGHCVQESFIKKSLLIFGISNIDETYNDNMKIRKIKNYVIHPDYDNTTSDADLAIFELSEKLEFSNAINSVCLCGFEDCFENNVYQRGLVAGWGKNEMGVPSRTLKKIETTIVDEERCLRSADEFNSITSNRTFCAGDRNGNGPCNGDSGSGFYMFLNGRWIIKGIVSRSLARSDGGCNLDEYIVYVDVSQHFNWVKRYIDTNNVV